MSLWKWIVEMRRLWGMIFYHRRKWGKWPTRCELYGGMNFSSEWSEKLGVLK